MELLNVTSRLRDTVRLAHTMMARLGNPQLATRFKPRREFDLDCGMYPIELECDLKTKPGWKITLHMHPNIPFEGDQPKDEDTQNSVCLDVNHGTVGDDDVVDFFLTLSQGPKDDEPVWSVMLPHYVGPLNDEIYERLGIDPESEIGEVDNLTEEQATYLIDLIRDTLPQARKDEEVRLELLDITDRLHDTAQLAHDMMALLGNPLLAPRFKPRRDFDIRRGMLPIELECDIKAKLGWKIQLKLSPNILFPDEPDDDSRKDVVSLRVKHGQRGQDGYINITLRMSQGTEDNKPILSMLPPFYTSQAHDQLLEDLGIKADDIDMRLSLRGIINSLSDDQQTFLIDMVKKALV